MTMEAVLRMSHNPQLPSPSAYENAIELFLSEYPNGEIRKHKRRVGGYHSSGRPKNEMRRKKDQL